MKNKAAVNLGKLGGKKKLQIYGIEEYKRMSAKATLKRKAKKRLTKAKTA